jgi:hypothetical protein
VVRRFPYCLTAVRGMHNGDDVMRATAIGLASLGLDTLDCLRRTPSMNSCFPITEYASRASGAILGDVLDAVNRHDYPNTDLLVAQFRSL